MNTAFRRPRGRPPKAVEPGTASAGKPRPPALAASRLGLEDARARRPRRSPGEVSAALSLQGVDVASIDATELYAAYLRVYNPLVDTRNAYD